MMRMSLLVAVRIMMRIMMRSTQLVGSGSGLTDSSMASPTLDEAAYWTFQFFSVFGNVCLFMLGRSPQSCTETDFEMKTSNFVLFLLISVVSVHFRAIYDETIPCQA